MMTEREQIIHPDEKMIAMVGNLMVVLGLGKRIPTGADKITISVI